MRWSATTGRPASATSWPCAAIRRPARQPLCAASRRLRQRRRSGRRHQADRRLRDLRRPAIRRSIPKARRSRHDIDKLKAKVDAGATRAITQFFFDNDALPALPRARRARAGIWAPIVPGIMPVHNFKQVAGFAGRCGATMPAWLAAASTGWTTIRRPRTWSPPPWRPSRCMELVDQGIRQFHFYTLNRADLVYAICHVLGLGREPRAQPRRPSTHDTPSNASRR